MNADVDILVRQQLKKAKQERQDSDPHPKRGDRPKGGYKGVLHRFPRGCLVEILEGGRDRPTNASKGYSGAPESISMVSNNLNV